MDRDVIYFQKGKLQVARSIICDLRASRTVQQTSFRYNPNIDKELETVYYALNRADASLERELEKKKKAKKA
jgi:hypothetical protein